MLKLLLRNHVLTNLTFVLVLVLGALSYLLLPREQEPAVNFNWVVIVTLWPGASATDVEKRVTDPLEEGLEKVQDIKFISSSSRENLSAITVRFNQVSKTELAERVADLRREVQNKLPVLPPDVETPGIVEVNSSNMLPTATVMVYGLSDDDNLRRHALAAKRHIERIAEVERVDDFGDREREIQVEFSLARMAGLGVSPVAIADSVKAYFRDLAAGSLVVGDRQWLMRLSGTSNDPAFLGNLPLVTPSGEIPLRSVADVVNGRQKPYGQVFFAGHPAVMLSVYKRSGANNLDLVNKIEAYAKEKNQSLSATGVQIALANDQTAATKNAVAVMENNIFLGLGLVLCTVWLFLGFRVSVATALGIPFALAGVFLVLALFGQTLNSAVLLAVVISLGMLVDDAIVVVESIDFHLRRGLDAIDAAIAGIQETAAPVTSAVLTTIAAFLPLTLMPGILGDYMKVVPLVVTLALVFSLVEAFWMLPAHVAGLNPVPPGRGARRSLRDRLMARFRRGYARLLTRTLTHPRITAGIIAAVMTGSLAALALGAIRIDFFAGDAYRFFYIDVQMPAGTSLEASARALRAVEERVRENLDPAEVRSITSYAGLRITEREGLMGTEQAQILVSLRPMTTGSREVRDVVDGLRPIVDSVPGPQHVSFLVKKFGPPTARAVSLRVKGDDVGSVRAAAGLVKGLLASNPVIRDVSDDDAAGGSVFSLRLNPDGVVRAGLNPADVARAIRLFADGEVVASLREEGERIDVRVRSAEQSWHDVDAFLDNTMALAEGTEVPLRALTHAHLEQGTSDIRHHNLQRAITVEADIDSGQTNSLAVNRWLQEQWVRSASAFPGVSLDFSGELDDVQESLRSLAGLFAVGLGLVYLILGTQFRSYIQPFLVLSAIPMAFFGVLIGLLVSREPLSLYTLYGVIALGGIAVNDAIVMVSAANRRLARGWTPFQAVVYAARRRVMPIVITSVTTIAGLLSLAAGWGGHSLMWGPMATAIVWGLGFSTLLTLFLVPMLTLYLFRRQPPPDPLGGLEQSRSANPLASLSSALARRLGFRSPVSVPRFERMEDEALYAEGARALGERDFEAAIRCFQALADRHRWVLDVNLLTVQSCLGWMQENGWDAGYMARSRRYLERARSIDPHDPRLDRLERMQRALDAADRRPPG